MCSTDVYCSKQTGSSSTKGNHHPSFLRFWNWAEESPSMQPKFVAAQKMLLKQKPSKLFVNDVSVLLLYQAFILRWKRVCIAHNNCMSCPSIWATLSAIRSLIYFWVPSSCFYRISLSEGEIIPFSGVCQSGERLHYPRRRRWWLHALTDRLL